MECSWHRTWPKRIWRMLSSILSAHYAFLGLGAWLTQSVGVCWRVLERACMQLRHALWWEAGFGAPGVMRCFLKADPECIVGVVCGMTLRALFWHSRPPHVHAVKNSYQSASHTRHSITSNHFFLHVCGCRRWRGYAVVGRAALFFCPGFVRPPPLQV
jgi:hypothetical protein